MQNTLIACKEKHVDFVNWLKGKNSEICWLAEEKGGYTITFFFCTFFMHTNFLSTSFAFLCFSVRNYVKDVLEIMSQPRQEGYEKNLLNKIVILSSKYSFMNCCNCYCHFSQFLLEYISLLLLLLFHFKSEIFQVKNSLLVT